MNTNENEKFNKIKLTPKKFVKMGFHVWRQFDDPYYAGFAAQIAYFFFMSSIPILIVLTQVLGIFDVSMDFIKEWFNEHLSTQMGSFLEGLFSASSAAVTNILMVILAIWAASSLEFSLSRLMTYTLTGGKYRFNWFVERAKAIPMALLSLVMVAFTVVFYVYGEMIASSIFKSQFIADLIAMSRTPMLAVLFFVVILINYYIIPRIKVPIRALLPGAILATVGIMIVTWIYSLYIDRAVNYNVLYGTFSNIVALLLWFYCISWVICIGMMFNKSWDIHLQRRRLIPERLKEYVMAQYRERGPEMWNKLYIGDDDVYDKKLDTMAVKFSRLYDPGYEAKRLREIEEYRQEQLVRKRVNEEVKKEMAEDKEKRGM